MKKFICTFSMMLVLTLLIGALPMVTPSVKAMSYGSNGKFFAPIDPPSAGSIAISTREQLEAIKENLGGTYHLTADIDLSGTEWEPIGNWPFAGMPFTGIFDGQGYEIRNLKITGDCQYSGLFGYADGATIKNVGMENLEINATHSYNTSAAYAGGICGFSDWNSVNISNCYNTGTVSISAFSGLSYAGGICGGSSYNSSGRKSGAIINCYNTGTVSASSSYSAYAGGMIGYGGSYSDISNCYNKGTVSASSLSYFDAYAGGICGEGSTIDINDCYNMGIVSASSSSSTYAGGINGYGSSSNISNCYNKGTVSASSSSSTYVGGICAYGGSNISDCHNTGSVSVLSSNNDSSYAGGITGGILKDSIIRDCYNTGTVSAASLGFTIAGGICADSSGFSTVNISNCYNTGAVSASATSQHSSKAYAGGISGHNFNYDGDNISNCYNTGAVTASAISYAHAGGICAILGLNILGSPVGSSISNCYNTGAVSASAASNSYAGGICGISVSNISSCYNAASVSALASYILDPSHIGSFSADAGGICGYSGGTTSKCYWNRDSTQTVNGSPQKLKKGVGNGADTTTPLTTAQMKQQASFEGFAFGTVWESCGGENDGYPVLCGLPHKDNKYPITVNLGTANPVTAIAGETVTITAIAPPTGGSFDKWTSTDGVTFANANSPTTTFKMPARAVTVTATYKSSPRTVTSVTVSPKNASVEKGKTKQFNASVSVNNGAAQTATWSVSGNKSKNTKISSSGKLTAATDETAKTLTITATSTADKTKTGRVTVTVTSPLKIKTQSKDKTVIKNKKATLKVVATGGTGTLKYQWYSSKKQNSGFNKISGYAAKKASYKAPAKAKGTKYYYCIVSDAKGKKITSKTIKIKVK